MAAPSPIPAGISKEQAFSMAQTEMEYRVELFNKLAQTCFVKCVDKRYKENELNMGENSCIDRCVSKYWQVNGMVGQLLSAGKPPPQRGGSSFFDPFSLDVWDPFKDFPSSSSFSRENSAIVNARVDWRETPEAHVFKADLPGLKKEEVKVEIEDDSVLKISGERHVEKEDKNDTWHRVERSSGQFTRKFRLPENVKMDQVKAAMENGVLTVTVPKAEMKKTDTPEAHVFKADLPGLKKEEVKVEVEDNNVLKISGQRHVEKEDKSDTWHRVERSSGQFTRKFRLPENVKMDQVKAALENGVLTVTVPKVETEKASVRSVQISG
ncbi:hypothetical protein HID58_059665 [Brassica napus]|uniref:SHSP domain-containing protein n=3 Tax=Brassica TaxID=3705 RepID=A0ABQ7ZTK3_BRANA|nr:hypothetical protein HID58_059665 [Brassica napus]